MTTGPDDRLDQRVNRVARKVEHALTLALVLELIAVARRIPTIGWMLIAALLASAFLLLEFAWMYWAGWVALALAALVAVKLFPGVVRGWRDESRGRR